ncbi:hypothetical protein GCM10022261_02200 [Brevibacterium daeguense]|uniref:DNA-packaging protein n=1 Tax=Brevibacterium daeguense TaxID=909936 RepID=A0ABP8EFC6_9MICO
MTVKVAGPAALLVAKLHKIAERADDAPHRLNDKDAHDAYRILLTYESAVLVQGFRLMASTDTSREVTVEAAGYLARLFSDGPHSIGAIMAGRAEEGVGEPEQVSAAVSFLAADLLDELNWAV